MKELNVLLDSRSIKNIIICDTKYRQEYFTKPDNKLGIVSYYYSIYRIDFLTYITDTKENLDDYKNILKRHFETSINKNYFCFFIKNRKLIYQNYTYKFYKKYLNKDSIF